MSVSFFDGKITLNSSDNIEISTKLSIGDVTRVNNNILPTTTESYDLGSAQYNFKDQHTTGNIWLDNGYVIQKNSSDSLSIRKRDTTQVPTKLKSISGVTSLITAGRLIDTSYSTGIDKQLDKMTLYDWEQIAAAATSGSSNLTLDTLFKDDDYIEDIDVYNRKRFRKKRGNNIFTTSYYLENIETSSGTAVELFLNGINNDTNYIFIERYTTYCLNVYIIGRSYNNKSVFIKSIIRIAHSNSSSSPTVYVESEEIRNELIPTIVYSIATTSAGKKYLKITAKCNLSSTEVIWGAYITSLEFKKSKSDTDTIKYDSTISLNNTSGITHRNCIIKGISTSSTTNLALDSSTEYLKFELNTISYITVNVNARQSVSSFGSYLDVLKFIVLCNGSGNLTLTSISNQSDTSANNFSVTPIVTSDLLSLTVQVGNSSSVSTRWVADLDILTLKTTSTMDTSSYYLQNRLNLDTTEKYYILKNEGTNVTLTLDGQAVDSDNVISISENKTYIFYGNIISDDGSNDFGIVGDVYGIAMRDYGQNATCLYNTTLYSNGYTCTPSISSNNLIFTCTSTPSVKWYLKLTLIDITLDYD